MHILGLQKTTLLDFPGKVASTIFTGGCNFRCPYCQNSDLILGNVEAEYSEEEIFAHLKKRGATLEGLAITGGEPTIQKDLYDFIKKVKDMGLLVKLDTNGTNPEVLEKLLADGLVDYVAMDIKAAPSKYNEVACMNNFSLDTINKSIELLKNSNIDYEFRTTTAPEIHTVEDMVEIGKWIEGAPNYFLQPYRESEQVLNPVYSAPSNELLDQMAAAVKPYVKNIGIRGID